MTHCCAIARLDPLPHGHKHPEAASSVRQWLKHHQLSWGLSHLRSALSRLTVSLRILAPRLRFEHMAVEYSSHLTVTPQIYSLLSLFYSSINVKVCKSVYK